MSELTPVDANGSHGLFGACRGRTWRGTVLLVAIASLVVTVLEIRVSILHGRLAIPPVYDDVAYMLDGATRLSYLYQGGVPRLARDIWEAPPHSPVFCGLAAVAFAIFGMHDWAPYVMTFFVAALVLGLAAYVLRRAPAGQRALVVLLVAMVPVTFMAVHEFRPDIAAAALIAWGAAIALDPPEGVSAVRRAVLLGLVFGASLLTKTSTCPVTLALFGLAVLVSGAMRAPRGGLIRSVVREGLIATGTLLVVAGPYYALAAHDVYEYIYRNIFGDRKELWAVGGRRSYHARYYLVGEGGEFMLGRFAYPLVALAVLGGVLARGAGRHAAARAGSGRIGALGLAAMIGLAYAVSAVNVMKQGFLGLPFQLLLLLAALLGTRMILVRVAGTRVPWGTIALAGAAAYCLATFKFPNTWPVQGNPKYRESARLHDEIYSAVRAQIGRKPAVVLLTFTGLANATNLQFKSVADGATIQFRSVEEGGTVEGYDFWLQRASVVVAAQSGTGLTDDHFPTGKLHDAMIERLDKDPRFERYRTLPGMHRGRVFVLYRKVTAAPTPARPPAGPPRNGPAPGASG